MNVLLALIVVNFAVTVQLAEISVQQPVLRFLLCALLSLSNVGAAYAFIKPRRY